MSQRVFLHVGSPKTGTTFLQRVLWANRDRAREQGLLLPGRNFTSHYFACLDVRENKRRVLDPGAVPGAWSRLAEEILAWDGDALVSHELFAPATVEQAKRAIETLAGREVHVLVTARDLVRQIPAEWQEHLKHRVALGFPEFVGAVRERRRAAQWFWTVQDAADVLDRWGRTLPREQVHVVTVPRAGTSSDSLWSRFTGRLGLDVGGFDLSAGRSNVSLRAEQAEMLRRLNAGLGERLPLPGTYPETVKSLLAHEILAERPGTRFGLVGADYDFAVERAQQMVHDLKRLDVDVVGDLEDLVPEAGAQADVSGDAMVPTEAVLTEALESLTSVLERLAKERAHARGRDADITRIQERVRELESARAALEPAADERDRLVHDMQYRPIRHLLIGQSMRHPPLARLRSLYRRLVDTLRAGRRLLRRAAGHERADGS